MEPLGGVKRTLVWPAKALVESIPEILIEGERSGQSRDDDKEIASEMRREHRPKGISPLKHLPFCGKFGRHLSLEKPEVIQNGHVFSNHSFKKATFCDVCHRLLVDVGSKEFTLGSPSGFQRQGLRCKICKANLHSSCTSQIEECQGSPLGSFSFSRQLSPSGSTPENGCFASAKVDSVYQVLKEGLVLRSTTASPGCSLNRNQSIDSTTSYPGSENGRPSAGNSPTMNNKFKKAQSGEINQTSDERVTSPSTRSNCSGDCVSPMSDQRPDKRRQNDRNETGEYTMVALHKFEAQQKDDLSLRPGDVITVTDDRDEAWLIGSRADGKSGFFPTNFAMIISAGESICSCVRASYIMDINNKEVQLKKNQIVVVVNDAQVPDHNFLYTRIPNVEGYVRKEDLKPL
ncbi:SH3 and cysteine-rich domain-containing protein 3 isoform X4 [Ciona intestinalis]